MWRQTDLDGGQMEGNFKVPMFNWLNNLWKDFCFYAFSHQQGNDCNPAIRTFALVRFWAVIIIVMNPVFTKENLRNVARLLYTVRRSHTIGRPDVWNLLTRDFQTFTYCRIHERILTRNCILKRWSHMPGKELWQSCGWVFRALVTSSETMKGNGKIWTPNFSEIWRIRFAQIWKENVWACVVVRVLQSSLKW